MFPRNLPFVPLVVAVLVAGCGWLGSEEASHCDAPAVVPAISVTDSATGSWPESAVVSGPVAGVEMTGSILTLEVDGTVIQVDLLEPIDVDLTDGQSVDIRFVESLGFGGVARGVRIDDADGPLLVVEDGDYGNALTADDLEPFQISQVDVNCRNRANRPGNLNNFALRLGSDNEAVELVNGERGTVTADGQSFTVVAGRSVARVDDVVWTDAPYQYTSFVVARDPQ